jgi:hypothetical protein
VLTFQDPARAQPLKTARGCRFGHVGTPGEFGHRLGWIGLQLAQDAAVGIVNGHEING